MTARLHFFFFSNQTYVLAESRPDGGLSVKINKLINKNNQEGLGEHVL